MIEIRYFPITALPDALLLGSRHRVLDAAGGLGGSVAVCEDFPWIFGNLKNRQEIYAARDQHPDTPRAEFYAQFVKSIDQSKIRVEVGE